MAFCENCGSEIDDSMTFCECCGAKIDKKSNSKDNEENCFCENCGSPIERGVSFCQVCGAKICQVLSNQRRNRSNNIKKEIDISATELFKNKEWNILWLKAVENAYSSGSEAGLIITDTNSIVSQSPNSTRQSIISSISNFISFAFHRNNVKYYLFDISDNVLDSSNNFDDNLYGLKEIINIARPKYLFIIGNTDCIDNIEWENECDDSDESVLSDLPYVTLDLNSPWNGQDYDYDKILRTGRLPTINGINFEDYLSSYIEREERGINNINTFGITAAQWEDTSDYVYSNFAANSCLNSPDVELSNILNKMPDYANFLYFNVHGSSQTKYWYGQRDSDFPEVVSPDVISTIQYPFIIGVEACYGGQNFPEQSSSESIVLSAFNNNCISMLASSAIAYGTPYGSGSCADILIGKYMQELKKGSSAGDAYIKGLKSLLVDNGSVYDTEIKTLAEFSLYGDPSFVLSEKKVHRSVSLFKSLGGVQKGLHVPIPDVRRAIKAKLVNVDEKLADPIKKQVFEKYKGYKGIEPKFFQISNTKVIQASFKKDYGTNCEFLKVYFDTSGKIKKEYLSK